MTEENIVLGKLNWEERKTQMTERRKLSPWLNVKLTELEVKHSNNKGAKNE